MAPVAGWTETQVSDMDFDTIMEKAYEDIPSEGLAENEEAHTLHSVSVNEELGNKICALTMTRSTRYENGKSRPLSLSFKMLALTLKLSETKTAKFTNILAYEPHLRYYVRRNMHRDFQ
ncbi:hypothetical protein QT332_22375 [Escherichia coli]|nr:hypothetical protein [Escherichia coli]